MLKETFARIGELISKRPLAVSLVAGAAAVLFAVGYIKQREAKILKISEPVQIAKAAKNIRAGEILDYTNTVSSDVPLRFAEPGVFTNVNEAMGHVAMVAIPKGTQVTASNSRLVREVGGLSAIIPSGRRAFALPTDDGVAGLIHPNDWVDVIATFDLGTEAQVKRTTMTLVEGAQVLAVGSSVADLLPQKKQKGERSGIFSEQTTAVSKPRGLITIAVTPTEAQKLAFAVQSGAVAFAVAPFGGEQSDIVRIPTTISTIVDGHEDIVPLKRAFREFKGR